MLEPARCERYDATAPPLERPYPALLQLHPLCPSRAARVQLDVWVGIMMKRPESSEYGVEDLEGAGLTIGSVQGHVTTSRSKVVV